MNEALAANTDLRVAQANLERSAALLARRALSASPRPRSTSIPAISSCRPRAILHSGSVARQPASTIRACRWGTRWISSGGCAARSRPPKRTTRRSKPLTISRGSTSRRRPLARTPRSAMPASSSRSLAGLCSCSCEVPRSRSVCWRRDGRRCWISRALRGSLHNLARTCLHSRPSAATRSFASPPLRAVRPPSIRGRSRVAPGASRLHQPIPVGDGIGVAAAAA